MFKKFIFFLAWVGVFILSLTGIVYAVVPTYFVQFNKYVNTIGYGIIVGIISVIYFFICIIKFLSLFERSKDYSIKTENGVVFISSETVTTFIREKLAGNKEISNIKIDTFKSGNKFNIKIRLDMISDGSVSDKLERIQKEIKQELAEEMGIEVGKVQIKISKLSLKDKPEETIKSEDNSEYENYSNL